MTIDTYIDRWGNRRPRSSAPIQEKPTWGTLTGAERNRRYRKRARGEAVPAVVRPALKTKPCLVCGEPVRVYPSRPFSKYCSYACQATARRGLPNGRKKEPKPRTCRGCGASYVGSNGRQYCSYPCAKRSARAREVAKRTLKCPTCGATFQRGSRATQKYCSRACFGASLRRDEGEGPVGRAGYRGADWRERAATIRERDGHTCRNCHRRWQTGDRTFPVDHIKPWREFDTVEEANDPRNLVTLCHSCHSRKTFTIERRALSGDRVALNWWRGAVTSEEHAPLRRAFLLGVLAQWHMRGRRP